MEDSNHICSFRIFSHILQLSANILVVIFQIFCNFCKHLLQPAANICSFSFAIEDSNHMIPSILEEENPLSLPEESFVIDESERREIEDLIGYNFNNPALLQQAFTHGTCEEEPSKSYERLEFMGDAVLGLLVATKHFFDYPDYLPGKLTPLRSSNVDTEKLARASVKWSLHKHLRHKKPLLDGQIEDFLKEIEEYPTYSAGLVQSPKNLADVFESLVGAIYIDSQCSLPITQKVVLRLLEPMVTSKTFRQHPVARLHEFCQKHGLKLKFKERKLPERGEVEVRVYVDDERILEGTYVSKRVIASNRAANDAYAKIASKVQEPHDANLPCLVMDDVPTRT